MSTAGSTKGGSSSNQPRQPTNSGGSTGKPSKPDLYYGDRNKLNNWLLQFSLYFRYTDDVDDDDQVVFAATFMRGKTLSWINTDLQKYLDGEANTETKRWIEDFSLFKERIKRTFGPANEEATAQSVIQRLLQTKSAADYTVTFQHFAASTSWDQSALMSMYKRGLKDNVQDELMRYGGHVSTISRLMEVSIELDEMLHQRGLDKALRGRNTGRVAWVSNRGRRDSWGQDMRGDPMELDVLQPKSKGTSRDSGQRKCYSCGKPGHIARNCRSKDKVQRPQLNILLPKRGIHQPDQHCANPGEESDAS